MQLLMSEFLYFLQAKGMKIQFSPNLKDFSIDRLCFLTDHADADNTLYLNTGAIICSDSNVVNILTEEPAKGTPCSGIFSERGKEFDTVNVCLGFWQEFLSWNQRCRQLALVEHDLDELLKAGADFLRCELTIYDREYRYDGGVETGRNDSIREMYVSGDMDQEQVEELYLADPDFDETFRTAGLTRYSPPRRDDGYGYCYYYNFRYETVYLGRILYLSSDQVFMNWLSLMEGFSELVSSCYEYHFLRKNQGIPRHSVFGIWKQLLLGEWVDRAEGISSLQGMNWSESDRYAIHFLQSNGYFYSEETLKFYAVKLEELFPECVAVQTEGGIFLLHNLDRESTPDFRQHLADFLRDNLFVSGISNVFSDFFESRRYSLQAKDALDLGFSEHPSIWRHEFRDYQAAYIYRQCLSRYSARDLCPPKLERLLEYEEEHPELELVKTLRSYFDSRFNAAEAAAKMFIHRTTFFHRYNKILKITSLDVENPEERLQIQLYFSLADEELRRNISSESADS